MDDYGGPEKKKRNTKRCGGLLPAVFLPAAPCAGSAPAGAFWAAKAVCRRSARLTGTHFPPAAYYGRGKQAGEKGK